MKALAVFFAGYVVGARAGSEDFDTIVDALKAIRDSDEFKDLIGTLRAHAGHTLRELASMVETEDGVRTGLTGLRSSGDDLVERVRQLIGRDHPSR